VISKPPIILTDFRVGVAVRCLILLLFSLLAACQSSPPVQEMSDARQAIAVAREAGAEQYAAHELKAAEGFLDQAERRLLEKSYTDARRNALQAKESALSALSMTDRPKPEQ